MLRFFLLSVRFFFLSFCRFVLSIFAVNLEVMFSVYFWYLSISADSFIWGFDIALNENGISRWNFQQPHNILSQWIYKNVLSNRFASNCLSSSFKWICCVRHFGAASVCLFCKRIRYNKTSLLSTPLVMVWEWVCESFRGVLLAFHSLLIDESHGREQWISGGPLLRSYPHQISSHPLPLTRSLKLILKISSSIDRSSLIPGTLWTLSPHPRHRNHQQQSVIRIERTHQPRCNINTLFPHCIVRVVHSFVITIFDISPLTYSCYHQTENSPRSFSFQVGIISK